MRDVRRGARPRRRRFLLTGAVVLALLAAGAVLFGPWAHATRAHDATAASGSAASSSTASSPGTGSAVTTAPSTSASSPTGPPPFDRGRYSTDAPDSIWVVVDKARPLNPLDYAPTDLVDVGGGRQLRAEAAAALQRMFADAAALGLPLDVESAYRSYIYQQGTFASGVARLGEAQALRGIARPGYSEHQTGLGADIGGGGCHIERCFADTAEGRWVAENGYRYGFVLRYPDGAEAVTGYKYEPWHVRYVGVALATEMHDTGPATLEEFFGLPPAPSYVG